MFHLHRMLVLVAVLTVHPNPPPTSTLLTHLPPGPRAHVPPAPHADVGGGAGAAGRLAAHHDGGHSGGWACVLAVLVAGLELLDGSQLIMVGVIQVRHRYRGTTKVVGLRCLQAEVGRAVKADTTSYSPQHCTPSRIRCLTPHPTTHNP